jgi:hypothetical protein
MISYIRQEGQKYPGSMYSMFIKSADQVDIPDPLVEKIESQI